MVCLWKKAEPHKESSLRAIKFQGTTLNYNLDTQNSYLSSQGYVSKHRCCYLYISGVQYDIYRKKMSSLERQYVLETFMFEFHVQLWDSILWNVCQYVVIISMWVLLPSRELRYPTRGKGQIIFKSPSKGDMFVPRRVIWCNFSLFISFLNLTYMFRYFSIYSFIILTKPFQNSP